MKKFAGLIRNCQLKTQRPALGKISIGRVDNLRKSGLLKRKFFRGDVPYKQRKKIHVDQFGRGGPVPLVYLKLLHQCRGYRVMKSVMRAMITPARRVVAVACHFFVTAAFATSAVPAPSVAVIPFPAGLANQDGTGMFPALVHALYGEAGTHVGFYPAKRAFKMYDANEVQVLVSVPICRWKDSHFLTLGLTDFELFLGRTGLPLPMPGDDLGSKTIAVVAGYTHLLRTRRPDWRWYETRDYEQAIKMLIAGRVDYVYGYAFMLADSITRLKLPMAVHYDINHVFDQTIPAIAFHANADGLAEAKKLQTRMKELVANGRYQRLMQSYGYPDWYYRDGLDGKITIVQQNECPEN